MVIFEQSFETSSICKDFFIMMIAPHRNSRRVTVRRSIIPRYISSELFEKSMDDEIILKTIDEIFAKIVKNNL